MATFSRQFLSQLGNPAGMLQGAANLGGAIGGIPSGIEENRFQRELAAIDTTTLAGQIEAQQKLLGRESDPRVILQLQSEISRLRKLQNKEASLDAYIAANPGIPKAQQDLLTAGNLTVGQSMTLEKTRKELEAMGELNLTEIEQKLVAAGMTASQILTRRSSGVAAKEQISVGQGRINNLLKSDEAKAYVRGLYPDVKTDAEYYSLIGGLKQTDFDDNVQSFTNNNFSKGLRAFETETDKEKTFYTQLADSVDNRFINIKDARAQIKLFKAGIDITVPVEYENKSTGEAKFIVKVSPKEGDQYMAILNGDGTPPTKVNINDYEKTKTKPKAYTPKYGTVTDRNITSAMNYIETKYDVESNDYKDDLAGLLAETANFVQKNSKKSVSYKEALEIAEKFLKIKTEGGNVFRDPDIIRPDEDVEFEKLLQQIRPTGTDLPVVTTQDQFDALPPGSEYKDKDGNSLRKPL
jgi:hypothetical protein